MRSAHGTDGGPSAVLPCQEAASRISSICCSVLSQLVSPLPANFTFIKEQSQRDLTASSEAKGARGTRKILSSFNSESPESLAAPGSSGDGAAETAWWVKALVAKPANLSSIPGLLQVSL